MSDSNDTGPQGHFTKKIIKDFVEFGCERQLFLYLGEGDARWIEPLRTVQQATPSGTSPELLYEMGSIYEQNVYSRLRNAMPLLVRGARRRNKDVTQTDTTPADWRALAEDAAAHPSQALVLLEYQWAPPEHFIHTFFDISPESDPVAHPPQGLRPDITVVSKRTDQADRALRADGSVVAIDEEDERVAVRFIDIKHTNPEAVGKKQFIELLLYAHVFAAYLEAHDLTDLFYVSLDGHGIWPQLNLSALSMGTLADLEGGAIEMEWDNHAHLFGYVRRVTRRLVGESPRAIESVDVRIQPACARCRFIDDCRTSLGYDPEDPGSLATIDVRLMPYTSPAVAEQLREAQLHTVADVHTHERALGRQGVPTPLYAERPLLKLKADALVRNERRLPEVADGRALRHMSVALPAFNEGVVTFNAEADPTNECVFAFGLHLNIVCVSKDFGEVHEAWWSEWERQLEQAYRAREVDIEAVRGVLDEGLRDYLTQDGQEYAGARHALERMERSRIRAFANALWTLKDHGDFSMRFDPSGDKRAMIQHTYSFINRGLDPQDERALAREAVRLLHAILIVCSVYEELCGVVRTTPWGDTQIAAPSTAGFYWSADQLIHIQDMMERHLTYLLTDAAICREFNELLLLMSPSESSVATEYQMRKLYDMRAFVETSVGLPQIINYTWHEVAEAEIFGGRQVFSRKWWPANFNYMDFLKWHEMIQSRDMSHVDKLQGETERKATTIRRLVRHFQSEARSKKALSKQAAPIPSRKIPWRTGAVSADFNFIARAWALYSKLNASMQAQEALNVRLTFPAQSIGKLKAARISRLRGDPDDQTFTFELRDVSANARFGEGDWVLLVHDSMRDWTLGTYSPCVVVVNEMSWDGARAVYAVSAKVRYSNHPHPFFDPNRNLGGGDWYLYPRASDAWSGKLFESADNLLRRDGIGAAWLGQRAAYLMGMLGANEPLTVPEVQRVPLNHLYMYAPTLLPGAALARPDDRDEITLHTKASPAPDVTQREAIELALTQTISCIQGPPGTGKSETIAALIDEYLHRHPDGPVTILVNAYAYAPLEVVIERIHGHTDADGNPTLAGSMPLYFYGSEERCPDLDDLHHIDAYARTVDGGPKLDRRKSSGRGDGSRQRLEDLIEHDRIILFANAHQLVRLGQRTYNDDGQRFELLHDDFAFDLIVVDEASQMPLDGSLPALELVRRGEATLTFLKRLKAQDLLEDMELVEGIEATDLRDEAGAPLEAERLTRVVIVGDHNQLPPVRPVEPPEGLTPILGSMFEYFVEHQGVPSSQLATNYRSRPEIVAYTRHLGLYERHIEAFHQGDKAHPPLAEPPEWAPNWLRLFLKDECAVSAVVHTRQFETAVSPLEARLVRDAVMAFLAQRAPADAEAERAFWRGDVGIVAPHNAQVRLIIRELVDALTDEEAPAASHLGATPLEEELRQSIYTVEKFQGSARTFIIASMGISSPDQLAAEETFIYDMNRLNVLTSRARQKMMLVCSRSYLDYLPRHREVVPASARAREYVDLYCNQHHAVQVRNEHDEPEPVELRWHNPSKPIASVPRPRPRPPEASDAEMETERLRQTAAKLGIDYDQLDPHAQAQLAAQLDGMLRQFNNS